MWMCICDFECMWVYVCVGMYECVCECEYVCMNVCACVNVWMCKSVCEWICRCLFMCVCMCGHIYAMACLWTLENNLHYSVFVCFVGWFGFNHVGLDIKLRFLQVKYSQTELSPSPSFLLSTGVRFLRKPVGHIFYREALCHLSTACFLANYLLLGRSELESREQATGATPVLKLHSLYTILYPSSQIALFSNGFLCF